MRDGVDDPEPLANLAGGLGRVAAQRRDGLLEVVGKRDVAEAHHQDVMPHAQAVVHGVNHAVAVGTVQTRSWSKTPAPTRASRVQ